MADVRVIVDDMRAALRELPDASLDSCVCDPPYHLTSIVKRFGAENATPARANGPTGVYKRTSKGFMGQQWDGGDLAFQAETWAEVLRVLKPGGHLVAFSGTRTYHRMVCAIEDAGFEIRDQLAWVYGSGFPKSQNVAKAIDKAKGVEGALGAPRSGAHADMLAKGQARRGVKHEGWDRPWMDDAEAVERAQRVYLPASEDAQRFDGYGTALKPSWEPICLARKPLIGSVAQNVLTHGTGALNVDGCRIEGTKPQVTQGINTNASSFNVTKERRLSGDPNEGRWPANLCHDGSEEVLAGFPETESGVMRAGTRRAAQDGPGSVCYGTYGGNATNADTFGDSGSAARFFYCAKAGRLDRLGSTHPTVKPVELMRWLVRLVTPAGGTVLDPFAGTGSTGIAAFVEGLDAILVEMRQEAADDIQRRLDHIRGLGRMTALEMAQVDACPEKTAKAQGRDLPLFGVG